jgi:hypothetical protein
MGDLLQAVVCRNTSRLDFAAEPLHLVLYSGDVLVHLFDGALEVTIALGFGKGREHAKLGGGSLELEGDLLEVGD